MKVTVLSDTHIPKKAKDLPAAAYKVLQQSDAIIHAGDVVVQEFLDRLKEIAPVYAVRGNNDHGVELPEQLELKLEGVDICVIHDSGDRKGREKRMRKLFPEAKIVIFGHSHIPVNDSYDGMLLFNPGSPTDKRRQAKASIGMLQLNNGLFEAKIIELD